MAKRSEYLLNSLEADNEKIRNVFTTNLWKQMTNSHVNSQYVELFINQEYVGLYSLENNIEEESLLLKPDEFLFYKKNFIASEKEYDVTSQLEGYILYNRRLNKINHEEEQKTDCLDDKCLDVDAWQELNNYYKVLYSNDASAIKKVTNLNNAIDIYLFYLFVQAEDSIQNNTFANTYLVFKKDKDSYRVEYIPGILNNTFNSSSTDQNFTFNNSPVQALLQINDQDTIRLVKERYNELRKSTWSEDNIEKILDKAEQDIFSSGAYLRDSNNYKINTKTKNLNSFRSYLSERLKSLDKYIENL